MLKQATFLLVFVAFFYATQTNASTLTLTQGLSFGTVVKTASTGSISVSTGGSTSGVTGVSFVSGQPAATQGALVFTATGLDILVNIAATSFTPSSVTFNNTTGTGSVTVSNFNTSPTLSITLLANPVNITLGGTLTFSGTVNPGIYSGNVTVNITGLTSGSLNRVVPISFVIWNTLSVSETTPMHFGVMSCGSGTGTIRLTNGGTRSVFSGTSCKLVSRAPSPAAGKFTVSGQPSAAVTVTTSSPTTLSSPGANGTLTLNNFSMSTGRTLDSSGQLILSVGADLTMPANTSPGTYTGTYQLTVNY